jgi:hypothetical protein
MRLNKEEKIFRNFIKALFRPDVKRIQLTLIDNKENKIASLIVNADLFKEIK